MSEQFHLPAPERRVVPYEEADAALKELGLSVEIVHQCVTTGDLARRRVDQPVYPVAYPAVTMWAESLAELRRRLLRIRQNWKIGQTGNYETVYSEERNTAFAVVGGNKNTGINGRRDPKLNRKRGPRTKQRITANAKYMQDPLPFFPSDSEKPKPPDEDCLTWFVVLHATESKIYIEVSLPSEIGEDDYVSGWAKRILVSPIQAKGAIVPISVGGDDDDGEDDLVGR